MTVRAVKLEAEFLALVAELLEPDGQLLAFGTSDPLSGFDLLECAQLGDAGPTVTLYQRS